MIFLAYMIIFVMDLRTILNSIGLVISIIGTILVFKFGLPEKIETNGECHLLLESTNNYDIKKAKKYDKLSSIAIKLLILGFTLQLISNFI